MLTDEQLKGVWEWCGMDIRWDAMKQKYFVVISGQYKGNLPKPDLDNLFKYADRPLRFRLHSAGYLHILNDWVYKVAMNCEDPAEALLMAIWEVIKEG